MSLLCTALYANSGGDGTGRAFFLCRLPREPDEEPEDLLESDDPDDERDDAEPERERERSRERERPAGVCM